MRGYMVIVITKLEKHFGQELAIACADSIMTSPHTGEAKA